MDVSESESEVAHLCLTLCDTMDCSLSGSSVHGIFQARVLEWIATSFSRGSSQHSNRSRVSHISGWRFSVWATRDMRVDYKESWAQKNWWFWTVVLEKSLESSVDCNKIQLVHPEGNQSWVFIGWTDIEAESPIFWPPDVKSWLIWKDPDFGRDWWREEKGTTEDEIVRCHYWLNGYEFG